MRLVLTMLIMMSTSVFAEESKDSTQTPKTKDESSVESIVKGTKKERKKKVQMCHDCGKPEVECTCEGEEHKKDE